MTTHFGEVIVALLNGEDVSIEKVKSKLSLFHERKDRVRKLIDIVNHPNFVSLDRIDKLVRLHEIVHKIKTKNENDTDFIAGYDEAIEIFRSLDS